MTAASGFRLKLFILSPQKICLKFFSRALSAPLIALVIIFLLDRFFIEGGKQESTSYLDVPKLSFNPTPFAQKVLVAANFVEVTLAKRNTTGLIGINFLEKIQLATPASVFGAILADVDYILMGAGIPADIPKLSPGILDGAIYLNQHR